MSNGLQVKRVPLSAIHADPANVRVHPEKNLQAIEDSLKAFGQVEPLVVQKSSGKVIGGNGRLEVMRKTGVTECDIVEIDVDDVRATAIGIALNRSSSLATFDDGALAKLLESLPKELQASAGFGEDDLAELLAGLSEPGGCAPSLADRFGVPPFSVLDARAGYWQDRKRQWLAMGIESELGRGGGGVCHNRRSPNAT